MRDLLPASRVARLASGRALTQLRLHYRARRLIAGALHVAPAPRGMNRRVDDRALQSPRGSDTRRQAGLAASNALRAPASLRSAFPRRTSTALVVIADPRLLGRPDDAGAPVTSRSRRHLLLRHAEPHAPVGRQTRVARNARAPDCLAAELHSETRVWRGPGRTRPAGSSPALRSRGIVAADPLVAACVRERQRAVVFNPFPSWPLSRLQPPWQPVACRHDCPAVERSGRKTWVLARHLRAASARCTERQADSVFAVSCT